MSDFRRPDETDALTAAPGFHRLILENDAVRVLQTMIPPGQTVPPHTHCWPGVNTFLSWSDFIRRDGQGEITLDTSASGVHFLPGESAWSGPLPLHTLENVGEQPLHVVTVEIKNNRVE